MNEETKTEKEMREAKVPWPKTIEELVEYINSLTDRTHDYGTTVYAMSMAATAAFYYAAHKVGSSGFQASCADLDILRRTRGFKAGFAILNYENLLYPQCLNSDHFPTHEELLKENKETLSKLAKETLMGFVGAREVRERLEYVASLDDKS